MKRIARGRAFEKRRPPPAEYSPGGGGERSPRRGSGGTYGGFPQGRRTRLHERCCVRGRSRWRARQSLAFPSVLRLHGLSKAVAFAVHLEDVAAVGQPVEQGGGHAFALEDLAPIAEGQVAGDQQAGPLVTVGKELEEQLRTRTTERQVAELVADEQVGLVELSEEAVELVLLLVLLRDASPDCRQQRNVPCGLAGRRPGPMPWRRASCPSRPCRSDSSCNAGRSIRRGPVRGFSVY